MADIKPAPDVQQVLQRLSQEIWQQNQEAYTVSSSSGENVIWVIKVISHYDYNVYNVIKVIVGVVGAGPTETGIQIKATNVAESFLQQGQLSSGTYAVMFRIGDKNIFYAVV